MTCMTGKMRRKGSDGLNIWSEARKVEYRQLEEMEQVNYENNEDYGKNSELEIIRWS